MMGFARSFVLILLGSAAAVAGPVPNGSLSYYDEWLGRLRYYKDNNQMSLPEKELYYVNSQGQLEWKKNIDPWFVREFPDLRQLKRPEEILEFARKLEAHPMAEAYPISLYLKLREEDRRIFIQNLVDSFFYWMPNSDEVKTLRYFLADQAAVYALFYNSHSLNWSALLDHVFIPWRILDPESFERDAREALEVLAYRDSTRGYLQKWDLSFQENFDQRNRRLQILLYEIDQVLRNQALFGFPAMSALYLSGSESSQASVLLEMLREDKNFRNIALDFIQYSIPSENLLTEMVSSLDCQLDHHLLWDLFKHANFSHSLTKKLKACFVTDSALYAHLADQFYDLLSTLLENSNADFHLLTGLLDAWPRRGTESFSRFSEMKRKLYRAQGLRNLSRIENPKDKARELFHFQGTKLSGNELSEFIRQSELEIERCRAEKYRSRVALESYLIILTSQASTENAAFLVNLAERIFKELDPDHLSDEALRRLISRLLELNFQPEQREKLGLMAAEL